MAVGNNISAVTYYTNEWTFTDVFKMSRSWLTRTVGWNGWDSGKFNEIPTDSNGYPLRVPFTAADGTRQFVHTLVPAFTQGTYTLVVTGKGKIAIRLPNVSTTYTETFTGGTATRTFNVNTNVAPTQTGQTYSVFLLELQQSDSLNPITNIKLIMPTFFNPATNAETEIFHPLFKQRFSHFTLLRHMDFLRTNGSPVRHFSDRTLRNSQTQGSENGAAYEWIADLSNEINKDLWICIPHKADNNYVQKVAQLLKNQVNPNLKIYVEYSNETWNTMFSQTTFVQDTGQVLNLSADRWEAGQLYVAKRSGEIFHIFENEFGTNNRSRLVFVMATQNGSAWLSNMRLNGLANPAINPFCTRADVLAPAPYLTLVKSPTDVCNGACIPSANDLVLEAQDKVITETKPTISALKTVADNNKISLVCYEGGQHMVGLYEAINYQTMTQNMWEANHDSRMYALYRDYLDTLKANGVMMFANFSSCGAWSKYGSWGLIEYQTQPDSVAHKYRAIKNWVLAHPFTRDEILPSTPLNLQVSRMFDASAELSWSPSTDNVGIFTYIVYVDGKIVGLTQNTHFLVPNLNPNTAYTFSVRAKDKAVNYSNPAQITATTLASPNVLLACDFTGTNPSTNAIWSPTLVLSPQITYSGIQKGAGIVPTTNLNNVYGFSVSVFANPTRSTLQESMNDGEFVSFKIKPINGKALNLNNAKFNLKIKRLSGASPQSYAIFSSVKGFAVGQEIFTYQYTNDYDTTINDVILYFPENGYNGLTDTLEFRIYGYNAQYAGHRTSFTGLSIATFTPISDFVLGTLNIANLNYNSLTLNWSATTNTTGFLGYDIFQDGTKINASPINATTYGITNLVENTHYNFLIRAKDANGNILYSSVKSFVTTPTQSISYNLVNFHCADALATLSLLRTFSLAVNFQTMPFNTTSNGQLFNSTLAQHQFSGGVQVDFSPNTAVSGNTAMSLRKAGDGYLPSNIVVSTHNNTNPSKITLILMWTKDKFLNTPANKFVQFDNTNNSTLDITVNGLSPQNKEVRLVIRNGNTYYLSEMSINATGTYHLAAFGNNSAAGKRWGVFDPTLLTLPSPLPTFQQVIFNDVQEIGFLYMGSRTAYAHTFNMSDLVVNGLVKNTSAFPIEMADFSAHAENEKVQLAWQTLSELNSEGFEIEYFTKENTWQKIAFLKSNNLPSAYHFTHQTPQKGENLYRLKLLDSDGNFSYSQNVSAFLENVELKIIKMRNEIRISGCEKDRNVLISLQDLNGKELFSTEKSADNEGNVWLSISPLVKGIYVLSVRDGHFLRSEKIVLE